MALSFLTQKVLRAEVTEGIDLESGTYLTGDRITIGTGPADTLRLGTADIAAEQLTLMRDASGKGWEYFASDRGVTAVDRGNQRTGKVRPGMWFRLGADTRIDILSVPRPAEMAAAPDAGGKQEVPLAVALPVMGVMLIGFLAFMVSLGGDGGSTGGDLRTAAWYSGAAPLEPSLDACLATGLEQAAQSGPVRVAPTEPDALFRAQVAAAATGAANASQLRDELAANVRGIIAKAHLLAREGRNTEASDTLRRLENVLPVDLGECPILSAARFDLAVLDMRGDRQ